MKSQLQKIILCAIFILALTGLVWSFASIFASGTGAGASRNAEEYFRAELADKCQTPPGYTDKDWQEHMSHHPDQYAECLAQE